MPPTAPPVDPCESQPCLNEGRCITRPNQTFVCVCSSSFAGPTCAENADGEPTEGRLGNVKESYFIIVFEHFSKSKNCLAVVNPKKNCNKFRLYVNNKLKNNYFAHVIE